METKNEVLFFGAASFSENPELMLHLPITKLLQIKLIKLN
jgi:hypothetical protein